MVTQRLSHSCLYFSLVSPCKIAKRFVRQLADERGGSDVASKTIQAAGGIVVRGSARALFAVVQRSKDDKWVLPRGKLKRDENPITGARREVVEETGHRVGVNEFLGAITYRAGGRPKVVQFWQMQAEDEASHELMADIVAVDWLPLKAAVRRLSYPLEKLFLRNVGRRAAKARKGRKMPSKVSGKAAPKKLEKKAGKKARKKAAKKAGKKSKKRAGKRVGKPGKVKVVSTRRRAKVSAVKKARSPKTGAGKRSHARQRQAAVHNARPPAVDNFVKRHAAPPAAARPSSPRPSSPRPAAELPAKPISAAERKSILQRMLGRLGA